MCKLGGRDHNATSYSTETSLSIRGILRRSCRDHNATSYSTETLAHRGVTRTSYSRDHNATSYSTETFNILKRSYKSSRSAEIITLRAIALKQERASSDRSKRYRRDHNATSYSTETLTAHFITSIFSCRDHNATSYSTETEG